ncbi:SufE family protein [Sanguibacter suaedae]|uniref:SufE family protein n=1 Tax=Sanguibacter suaedae TaxID=2795737 RepID=A0A934MBG3_9MICO|nr:SufE family protein [Sanguibacter suaedae]MBI9115286.1 SufE family protein [Sanguibacter suaedae]
MSLTTPPPSDVPLPPVLAEIAEDLEALPAAQRLEMLVELGASVRAVPEPYASDTGLMEQVVECQSPVFVAVELEPADPPSSGRVTLHVSAPKEAPTTRGFAGVLTEGLEGMDASEVLAVPADLPARLGLPELVSPLRVAGMTSLLGRVQRQVRERLDDGRAS